MFNIVNLTALALTCSAIAAGEQSPPHTAIEANGIRVSVTPRRGGMSIDCDGTTVIKHSEIVVTTPPWTPHYYVGPTAESLADASVTQTDGVRQISIVHRGERKAFIGTELLTLHHGRRLSQVFKGQFRESGSEALIQWRIGALDPTIIVGRPFRAILQDGGEITGRVPVKPRTGSDKAGILAKGFRTIEFDSRIGPIRVDVQSAHPLVVNDYRTSKWADATDPYFWFGDEGTRFRAGDPVSYRIDYLFPPPPAIAEETMMTAECSHELRRSAPATTSIDAPVIVPTPKQMTLHDGWTSTGPTWGKDDSLAGMIIRQQWPTDRRMNRRTAPQTDSQFNTSFQVGGIEPDDIPHAEGYELVVAENLITLRSPTMEGFRHGLSTLLQLAHPDTTELRFRRCRIRDWPDLEFRGIHLFTGGKGADLHVDLVQRVLAPLKLNHLVLEAEYVEWDSHPEIHHPEYGMPKSDVRKIIQACAERHIQVTPLIQTLGHCQWMFTGDQNLELAEDPEAKWAYCVTNPASYEFVEQILSETIDLFNPEFIHLGHDEFADRGRVPYRDSSKPYTVDELFLMDTLKLHGWLKERGVKPMIWGDMLLGPGEAPDACHAKTVESAKSLRGQLPDDIVITDWHYATAPPEKFTSLKTFQDEGHKTIASTWYRAGNIQAFARAAHDAGAHGLLQTTWAGYSLDPESFAREERQYHAYVLAAESAWNASRPAAFPAYRAGWHFNDLLGKTKLPRYHAARLHNAEHLLINLEPAFNYRLAAESESGFFGLGPKNDLAAAPSGNVSLKGQVFQLAEPADLSALALSGRFAGDLKLPGSAVLTLDTPPVDCLAILHTTNFAASPGQLIATYTAEDLDSQRKQSIRIRYAEQIVAYDDMRTSAESPVVWEGTTKAGDPVALRVLHWELPSNFRVSRLTLESANATASPLILGITGIKMAKPGEIQSQADQQQRRE